MEQNKKFKRVLVANRGEIAIRIFRACKELGIRSVAIYSEEDKNTLFRTKADESYRVGKGKSPVDAYLAIDEIIELAKAKGVDAIHPGYGFLSENVEFAKACEEAGIVFIGPTYKMMENLGDKIQSKIVANKVGVPTIPGVEEAIQTEEDAVKYAEVCGYPVMLKAAAGGGGRGMRIVRTPEELLPQFRSAKSEAKKAFGIDDIFIEKYLERPKHIEVQVLGDNYGNLVHLYERDCSIQRRHQKVVEFTPAICISQEQRERICADALKIAGAVNYRSAGTVEFLVDKNGDHYFIEMNPRIQVEHTVTEMTTGIDIVQSQILIAQGHKLDSDEVNIKGQDSIQPRGYAIQCRVTTEDPINGFAPDTGVISMYRSASGFGIRLDGGNAFTDSTISPYYDSLLVKVTSWARSFRDATNKAMRALREMKITGVKTNAAFLMNVLNHPTFRAGQCDTGFIADNPELLNIRARQDKELKVLSFLGDKFINETKGVKPDFDVPIFPRIKQDVIDQLSGTKQILDEKGPDGLVSWILEQKKLLLTDTTMRDAQQSLMATRVRTVDMEKIAPATAYYGKDLFSLEMWGGATFDTSYRFLKEDPWERLDTLRRKMPNILFQMLIRGANGVGYKNYPDNVIRRFVKESADSGIDIFRIFDSLNWIEGMEIALDEVLNQGKVAEACICYTGDILDDRKEKYNLSYYVRMAKELEKRGSHILGIKDMSGLIKPMAARKLIDALKQEISIPIHLHTHDTSGNGIATILMAASAGVDIVDAAFNSMSGLTSQPALNSVVAAVENTERETGIDPDGIQKISDYWAAVRPVYKSFESELLASSAEIYKYEIPGGQYSNLKPQVESFGLGHKFEEVKDMYKAVNEMLGDIVKVTPSSKAVGDMAIFMVQNDLTPENIYEKAKDIDFPDSIVSYFEGMMGQPEGGFPEKLQKLVLHGKEPITCRPGELLPPEDFDQIKKNLQDELGLEGTEREALSYALYPKVFEDYTKSLKKEGNFRLMGSDIFFHGLSEGETCEVKIAEGKELVIKLINARDADEEGFRDVVFEVNGNRSAVRIKDKDASIVSTASQILYANAEDPSEIGANIPGNILKVLVKEGEAVDEKQPIAVIEAMKMETNILSPMKGTVDKIYVKEGQQVKAGELVAKLK
ncbi:pyruvate carboxylase [Anaerovorax odorimutans]|uniref:Pyruvate carboxylase n=1 Tax=Anaerovorax odorimutans TaxID=109327 RepID=A0ABT1RMH5_9FIRM|nr:pyruvate carboxylase [Anaerovorax odorimutans]MCQ4636394.1 pyruvate carboxylase [Anaerovorax odorimutans]